MPWVNEEMCVGCGVCVDECPVEAISMVEEAARIDEEKCIRCGRCHDACPEDAVRHDSERIPQEIERNLGWVKGLMRHCDSSEEKRALIERLQRYFRKEKKVADLTIEKLGSLSAEL